MNKEIKKIKLQLCAAETNSTVSSDIAPAFSIDHVSKINKNITELTDLLGIAELTPVPAGTEIRIYKTDVENTPEQVGEGEIIPLTKVTRKLARTVTLGIKKYRKLTSIESILSRGYDNAVNKTDSKLISNVQKSIKGEFFDMLAAGTAKTSGVGLQASMANAWAVLNGLFKDEDVDAVYFVNPLDVAGYLGQAKVTMQTTFGLSYIANFIGLGTVIVSNSVPQGKVIATAKQNLNGVYIDVTASEVKKHFAFTTDESGVIGMIHTGKTDNASCETLLILAVTLYPERLDGIVLSDIQAAVSEAADKN